MELDVAVDRSIRLKKVFSGVLFETEEGEKLSVCMRNGGFEISVKDTSIKSPDNTEYYRVFSILGGVVKELAADPCCENYKGDPV